MRLFKEIEPKKANFYFNILPMLTILFLVTSVAIFQSIVLIITLFSCIIIYFYFALIWRFVIGRLTYEITPDYLKRKLSYIIFTIVSIFNFLFLPVMAGLTLLVKDNFSVDDIGYVLGILIFMILYGFTSNYFQFRFISRNIAILKYGENFRNNKRPLSWITLAYYPMTASKTQKIINEIFQNR